jgi:serine/threonine protein kinase/predicted Zn-dependent protease
MDPKRWKQIEELLHSVLDHPAAEREAYLTTACAGDPDLEREVRSLMVLESRAGGFMQSPAIEVAAIASGAGDESASLQPGATISHFRIVEKLGAGGMGVVYKAEDTRLERFVALKFLPDDLMSDADALSRFRREARAASALNHPNICSVYDIGEYQGRSFIVMEYLQGTTVKDRLAAGPVTREILLEIAIAIADALDSAHRAGIIHRDMKPANLFITERGTVKILDFGLAKIENVVATAASSETQTMVTAPRAVMGTLGYMSPEQLQGKPLDARTDLYSFGVVLYEMASGSRPSISVRPSGKIDPDLAPVLAKCLEQNRELRYQSASEIRADLQRLRRGTDKTHDRRRWGIAAALVSAVILATAAYWYLRRAPALTDKDTIVLADFTNSTGDPVFDGTLRQGLSVQLEQSPYLTLISDQRIRETLRLMGKPEDTSLTPAVAKDVCERTSSAAVLEGAVAKLGSQYILSFAARNCTTGNILYRAQEQVTRKEDVLNSLAQIAGRFRARAGEPIASVEKLQTPLFQATTPSLEAFRVYSAAVKIGASADPAGAVPLLQRAVQLDPNFATAYAVLGRIYSNTQQRDLASQSITKAYELRDHASEAERFFIDLNYYLQVEGDLEQAQRIGESWLQTYPRDDRPASLLSSLTQWLGKYELSADYGKKALTTTPAVVFTYNNLGWAYVFLNRLPDAEHVMQEAANRKLESPDLMLMAYYIAFLRGDSAGMAKQLESARAKQGSEDWLTNASAFVAAYSGQLGQARRLSATAAAIARQGAQNETAALYEAGAGVREAFFGNATEARQWAAEAIKLSNGRDVEYGVAIASALAGDVDQANALARDLEKRFPHDTVVKFNYLPVLGAFEDIRRGRPSDAVQRLESAERFDFGIPGSWAGFYGNLYSPYVRGLAHLAAHKGAEAAVEFQKIVDHRQIVWSDPVGAIARLELGRAWTAANDSRKAKAAYEDFLTLWKDADHDIPILKRAKLEYANLP